MEFRLTMTCDNAAFEDDPTLETARILRELAEHLAAGSLYATHILRDANGNKVGCANFIP